MIFVCFVVFTFLFVAFFGGGKLSLDFHDLFYNLNFEKEKLLLKDLFEGCLILNYYCYELVFTFFCSWERFACFLWSVVATMIPRERGQSRRLTFNSRLWS